MQFKGKNANLSIKSVLFAIAIAIGIFFAMLLLASGGALASKNPLSVGTVYSLGALVLSGFVGGFLLTKLGRIFGAHHALIAISAGTLIYLAASLICSGGLGGVHLLNALCYLGAGIVGMLLGKRTKAKRKRAR